MLKRVSDPPAAAGLRARDSHDATPAAAVPDLAQYLAVMRRRGPMVVAVGLLATLLGGIYSLQLVPRYSATATLMLDDHQPAASISELALYGDLLDSGRIASELAVISSTDVAKRVATKLKLVDTAGEADSDVSEPGMLALAADAVMRMWDGKHDAGRTSADLPADEPLERAARKLQADIAVTRKGASYLIDVTFTSESPARAAAVANAFAEEYLVDQLETRYEATRRTNDWLNARLGDLRRKVRESERAVELFKAENNIVETQGSTLGDQEISKLNEQLILARAETAQAKVNLDQVKAASSRGADLSSFADAAQATAIGNLRGKANEIRRALAQATVTYGARHPEVVALRVQLADVGRQIASEFGRTVSQAENRYQLARSRESSIARSLDAVKDVHTETGKAEITLRELGREAQANKVLYENFLAKFKTSSEEETLKTSLARVIERASVPDRPSAPLKSLLILMSLGIGLGVGLAAAVLVEQLDRGFRSSKQVETELDAPCLALVPRADDVVGASAMDQLARRFRTSRTAAWLIGTWRRDASRAVRTQRALLSNLIGRRPLSPFAESIRAVRLGIRFSNVDRPPKIVMLTSALPGEGKSTIASNLAQHAMQAGERAILVDLDLRRPALTEIYAPGLERGVLDLVLDEATLPEVVVVDAESGLAVLPAPLRVNFTHTSEVLGSQRIRDLLAVLAKSFDLVVVDASPLLPVTDARVLLQHVDAMVLVVKWEDTEREAVHAALSECYQLDEKFIGIVLNDVIPSKARTYGYHCTGYYAEAYGTASHAKTG